MEGKELINDHIVNYLLGGEKEITDPVLQEWLAGSESNQQELERYRRIWEESANYMDMDVFDTNRAWVKVDKVNHRKVSLQRRLKNISYALSGVAAAVLLMVALSLTGGRQGTGGDSEPDCRLWQPFGDRSAGWVDRQVEFRFGSDLCL